MPPAKISLCMIVRDESDCLDRCLTAAKPYVDEICIVDTGSVDSTKSIAKSHGAQVNEIAWPDDFSEARNHSLEMATGDWILVLDADEVLRAGDEEEFRRVVEDPGAIGGFQMVVNHGDEGKFVSCLILRLFRNMPEHRFSGAMHEQVITPILDNGVRMNMIVVDQVLTIDHYGYTESVRQTKQKDERNRLHFERALAKEPENAYVWFKFGDFLRRFDDMAPVLDALGRAVDIVANTSDAEVSTLTYPAEPHALLALELLKLGQMEKAQAILVTARKRTRPTPMLHWVWGHLNLKLENWQEAFDAFEACHALDGMAVHVPAQPGITSGRSVFGKARALLGMGKKDEALELFESGAARWPDCADLQKATARLRISQRNFTGAIEICTTYLKCDETDAEFWQIGAEMMMELGLWDRADSWANRALERSTQENMGLCLGANGECAFGRADFEVAADTWAKGPMDPTCQAGMILIRIMVAEPIPNDVDLAESSIQYALNGILRRLRRAPQGERACQLLSDGLKQRAIPNSKVAQLIDDQLCAPMVRVG